MRTKIIEDPPYYYTNIIIDIFYFYIWYKCTESRFVSREPEKEATKDIPTDQSHSVKNYFGYEYSLRLVLFILLLLLY